MAVRSASSSACRARVVRTAAAGSGARRRARAPAALLLAAACWGARCAMAAGAESFAWPIGLQPALTATFGETRPSALHAGIDVKTWGRRGYAVRALAGGHIVRLRTSPWGYGRAVYQQLADGRTMVFAHLDRFAPRLAARVEAAQEEAQTYSVDLWLAPGELPVSRGDTLAWTGASGTGAPHLHLELRDANNQPINPLLHGFSVPDSRAPALQAVALLPFGAASLVDGGHEPVLLELVWDGARGVFAAGRAPVVSGRVGVAVLAYDRGDSAANELAPFSLELCVDGASVFRSEFTCFSYDDTHQVTLDRTYLRRGGKRAAFFNLFVQPGNRLRFYRTGPTAGLLVHEPEAAAEQPGAGTAPAGRLGPGPHELELRAGDVAGNRSVGRVRVVAAPPPQGAPAPGAPQESGGVELAAVAPGGAAAAGQEPADLAPLALRQRVHRDFVELVIEPDAPLAAPPRACVEERGECLPVRQTGAQEYRAVVVLDAGGPPAVTVAVAAQTPTGLRLGGRVELSQRAARPGEARTLVFGAGEARLAFAANSAYEELFPQWEPFVPRGTGALQPVGSGHAFAPTDASFDERVTVALAYPPGTPQPRQLAVFAADDSGRWSFLGNDLDADSCIVRARVRRLTRVALLRDDVPPRLGALQPAAGAHIRQRAPRLQAQLDDQGTGIGREQDIRMELDGRPVICEYDPDERLVFHQVRRPLAPGAHDLRVSVADLAGNRAVQVARFWVE